MSNRVWRNRVTVNFLAGQLQALFGANWTSVGQRSMWLLSHCCTHTNTHMWDTATGKACECKETGKQCTSCVRTGHTPQSPFHRQALPQPADPCSAPSLHSRVRTRLQRQSLPLQPGSVYPIPTPAGLFPRLLRVLTVPPPVPSPPCMGTLGAIWGQGLWSNTAGPSRPLPTYPPQMRQTQQPP